MTGADIDNPPLDVSPALARDELVLHYQPKVTFEGHRMTGVEALVRWSHPDLGLVLPQRFIPEAERSGRIVALGAWVMDAACEQAAQWAGRAAGTPVTVAVNVSPAQFDDHLIDIVSSALRSSGASPSWLEIEVTESAVMQDVDVAVAMLHELRGLGVHLALDDFGTGYSSLAYLRRFPLDEVKIDQSFVGGLGVDPEDSAIVAAIVALAHSFGFSVVAEGVETAEQAEQLRTLGCESAQGFYFARPSPAATVDALIDADPLDRRLPPVGPADAPVALAPVPVVVVADDTPAVVDLARVSLAAGGFAVHDAETGTGALELARRVGPDCVVLDVSMPDMDGLAACRELRLDPRTSGCAIVMLTARDSPVDKILAYEAGADEYIVKPFAPRDLTSRIRAVLRRRSQAAAPRPVPDASA